MNFLKDIKDSVLVFDGSKGYMLQVAGLKPGECPEQWNISHKDEVLKLHKDYVDSGCNVIQTNTFSGNRIQLEKHGLDKEVYNINYIGAKLAKEAVGDNNVYVAASIGPTGVLMEPSGDLTFEKAYEVFKEQVTAVIDGGVDLINFETFTDIAEMRAAIIAAKDVTDKPVISSMAFEQNFRTLMGTTPFACAKIMLALNAEIIGTNCSFGPDSMGQIINDMAKTGAIISVKPNAGLPTLENGETKYHQSAHEFSDIVIDFPQYNAHLVGGCCGTTPEFTKMIKDNIVKSDYKGEIDIKNYLFSLSKQVCIDNEYSIGNINITDNMDIDNIIDEVYEIAYEDFDVIEIIYNGDNDEILKETIRNCQNIIKQPIILSGDNEQAIENALRIYAGIVGIRKDIKNKYGAIVV